MSGREAFADSRQRGVMVEVERIVPEVREALSRSAALMPAISPTACRRRLPPQPLVA